MTDENIKQGRAFGVDRQTDIGVREVWSFAEKKKFFLIREEQINAEKCAAKRIERGKRECMRETQKERASLRQGHDSIKSHQISIEIPWAVFYAHASFHIFEICYCFDWLWRRLWG